MTSDNRTQNENGTEATGDSKNLRERVKALQEKVSSLDETLDHIEQTTEQLKSGSS